MPASHADLRLYRRRLLRVGLRAPALPAPAGFALRHARGLPTSRYRCPFCLLTATSFCPRCGCLPACLQVFRCPFRGYLASAWMRSTTCRCCDRSPTALPRTCVTHGSVRSTAYTASRLYSACRALYAYARAAQYTTARFYEFF